MASKPPGTRQPTPDFDVTSREPLRARDTFEVLGLTQKKQL